MLSFPLTIRLAGMLAIAVAIPSTFAAEDAPAPAPAIQAPAKPTAHEERQMEGWKVRVDARLLAEPNAALGQDALKLLAARLFEITKAVPEPALTKLRAVTIQIDLTHGGLKIMQYHPSAGWLRANGYNTALEKCVHIPTADYFASVAEVHRQPWAVLHELAHAYHDQVLGFNEPRIKAAWEKFCASGKYETVLTVSGRKQKHYALTNEREFFAEMSECYFGTNDFYPFVRGELKDAEPEIFALLQEIWGLPRK